MLNMNRNSLSAKVFALLMSCLLAISTFMSFTVGSSKAYATPAPYTPLTGSAPEYTGPLTWVDYTPPLTLGSVTGAVYLPISLDIDDHDNIYVAKLEGMLSINSDNAKGIVERISSDGQTVTDITYNSNLDLGVMIGIDVDRDGNVYVAENSQFLSSSSNEARILMLPHGSTTWVDITYGQTMNYATGVAVDRDGNVYAVDSKFNAQDIVTPQILKLPHGSNTWESITGTGATFAQPFGIVVDGEGNVFVSDVGSTNNSVGLDGGKVYKLPVYNTVWEEVTPEAPFLSLGLGVDIFDNVLATNMYGGNVMKLKYGGNSEDWEVIEATPALIPDPFNFDIAADSSGYLYKTSLYRGNVNKLMAALIYDANHPTGGMAPDDSIGYEPNTTATVSGNTGNLVRAGYTFEGWNTKADGTGTDYAPGAAINMTESITLYADWSPIPAYTVTYQTSTGGSIIGGSSNETVTSGSFPASVPSVTPDLNYTFLGWSSDGGSTFLTADQLRATAVTAHVTYTAFFKPPVTLDHYSLDNDDYQLTVGATHQTVVSAVYSDGSSIDLLSSGVTYSSSHPAVATVDNTGLVTAVASGQATITAEVQGVQLHADVTVASPPSNDTDPNPVVELPAQEDPQPEIYVDGVKQDKLAIAKKDVVDGRTVITVTLDSVKVLDKMKRDNNKLLTIPLAGDNQVVKGQLNAGLVKAMESNQAQIQIVTDRATYTLPASQINVDSISAQIGTDVALEDITVQIEISATSDEKTAVAQAAAQRNQFKMVAHPVDFEISASYGDQTIQANTFNSYVERMIALPEGVDSENMTTGVVLTADGELYHVPTVIVKQDDKTYALIKSLTNSTYSVIYNPREMDDVKGHWASAEVNDMSSRLIIQGVTATEFRPDAAITRAEFAAIVTRALGIQAATHADTFTDVGAADWYAGAVQAAVNFKLIDGYHDGTFRPNQNISRQEAAVILSRAAEVASLNSALSADEVARILSAFTDGSDAASWARESVATAIRLDLMQGNGSTLNLEANLTRAEAAALVRRFLQAGTLINS